MASKKPKDEIRHNELLEGVDAIGTIVEEDLGYIRKRLSEMQKSIDDVGEEVSKLSTENRILENNQQDMLETLKVLVDKLNHLEIRIATLQSDAEHSNTENYIEEENI